MADAPEVEKPASPAALPVPSSGDRALGPVDALSAYMAELRKHAPISREEEHELAVRWHDHGDKPTPRASWCSPTCAWW